MRFGERRAVGTKSVFRRGVFGYVRLLPRSKRLRARSRSATISLILVIWDVIRIGVLILVVVRSIVLWTLVILVLVLVAETFRRHGTSGIGERCVCIRCKFF